MYLENRISNEYNEKQAKIVNFKLNNLMKLNANLVDVCNASAIAYANFGEMPTTIEMLNQEDYNAIKNLCIQINLLIEKSISFLNDMHSDIDDYFKPFDYQRHIESKMSESINDAIRKFVADNVPAVDVPKDKLPNGSEYSYIINKDLYELQEELQTNFKCAKSFKTIK